MKRGLRVGVTANSHKVIVNLLEAALEAADKEGLAIRCMRKCGEGEDVSDEGPIVCTRDNAAVLAALTSGEAQGPPGCGRGRTIARLSTS